MTALWMVYAVALATLFGAAAACLEPALRAARRATRLAWAAALLASLLAPAGAWVLARRAADRPAPATADATGADPRTLDALLARARVTALPATDSAWWRALDPTLLAAWIAASVLSVGWLVLSRRRLRQALRAWPPATVAGEPVLLTPGVGPAAVGVGDGAGGRIVLPTWALDLDGERLALMLAHERSHLQARDPQLLAGAAVAVALAPWNPALWWQLRRLRVAVEIDCDRRVLRRHPDVAAYGALLLDVARRGAPRHGLHRFPLAAALSAPTPTTALERRIRTMTTRRPRHPLVRTLAFGALGAALVAAACEAPRPTGLKPGTQVPLTQIKSAAPEVQTVEGVPTEVMLRKMIAEHMPTVASGQVSPRAIWFYVDAQGKVVTAAFDSTSRANRSAPSIANSIDPNTIATVNVMKFGPGRLTRDSVGVIWIVKKAAGEVAAATAARPAGGDTLVLGTSSARIEAKVRDEGTAIRIAVPDTSASGVQLRRAGPAPIYLIDGQEVSAGPDGKPDLPAADRIEKVEVLKGAAAVKLYGDKATNGVVLITTKKN
jgi:TonB-dependent SusC/RagA subfamily outer membrane receptor